MTRSSLSFLGALIFATLAGIGIAKAQRYCPPNGGPCGCDAYRGCNPPASVGAPAYVQPRISLQEWAEQRRQAKVNAAYNKGAEAFNRKDWSAAAKYFEQALKLQPGNTNFLAWLGHTDNQWAVDAFNKGDWAAAAALLKQAVGVTPDGDPAKQTMQKNLASVQQSLDARQLEQQQEANRQREDAAAAEAMRNALSRMVDSVPSVKGSGGVNASGGGGSSGGLTFMGPSSSSTVAAGGSGGNASTGSPGGLNFMGPDASNTFGVKSNPSHPDLGPSAPLPSAKVDSALDQASSAAKSGKSAEGATSLEEAQKQAGCQFSDRNCAQPDHIQVSRPSQTPATAALLTHIPEAAQNNETIKDRVAWYQKYERNALETEGKLAEVQKQIDSGKGDPAILNAERSTLANQLNDQKKLQKMEEDDIKKQLVNIHAAWIEQPPQSAGTTTGKP